MIGINYFLDYIHGKLPYLAPIAVAIFVLISILIYTHSGYLFGHDTGVTVFNQYYEYAGL